MASATFLSIVNAYPSDTGHLLNLIFRAVIAIVFVGMNLLYQLLWKNNAKSDYFEAKGITELPPAEAEKEEYAPHINKPHICPCGYDLRADPDCWLHQADEEPPRCPGCERLIYSEDFDLRMTTITPLPEKSITVPVVEVIPPPIVVEPIEENIVEEVPVEEEVIEPEVETQPEEDEAPFEPEPETMPPTVELIGAIL